MRWSLGARWRAFTRWQALQPRAETQWAVQLRAGQTALEAGASFDEVEQLLLTNGGRQAPLARLTATELFRPPSPQPPSLRTTSPAAVDEQPPSMRSPPPAQSQPRSAHEQPHSHTALLSCRASPNRRRPAQVRRRSSERVGESSATSRGAAPLGRGHEMDTYLVTCARSAIRRVPRTPMLHWPLYSKLPVDALLWVACPDCCDTSR